MPRYVSADQVYEFILANAEEIDGQLICRASLIAELRRRGVKKAGPLRADLVRALTKQARVVRPHSQSRYLIVSPTKQAPQATRKIRHERFADRMGAGDEPGGTIITQQDGTALSHDLKATAARIRSLDRYLSRNVRGEHRWYARTSRYFKNVMRPTLKRAIARSG